MRTIVLDGGEMLTRAAAHDYLARRLQLPDYYGRNLDALADCLSEMGQTTLLVLYRQDEMAHVLGDYGESLVRVLRQAAEENPRLSLALDGEEDIQN